MRNVRQEKIILQSGGFFWIKVFKFKRPVIITPESSITASFVLTCSMMLSGYLLISGMMQLCMFFAVAPRNLLNLLLKMHISTIPPCIEFFNDNTGTLWAEMITFFISVCRCCMAVIIVIFAIFIFVDICCIYWLYFRTLKLMLIYSFWIVCNEFHSLFVK